MADIITTYHNSRVKPKIKAIMEDIQTHTSNINSLDNQLRTAESNIVSVENDILTLNSGDTTTGSVEKKIKDAINAFATAITDDGTVNTYKEVLDWISAHGAEFAALVGTVNANTGNISLLRDDLSNLNDDVDNIANGNTTITPTLGTGTTYNLDSSTYGFASLLAIANVVAQLNNGFAYNDEDSEWNFIGDVLNFGNGSGEIYLGDNKALTMNPSSYSGYGSLAAMATVLSGAVSNIQTIAASIPTTATINALTWD